jgi:hypothetical protein
MSCLYGTIWYVFCLREGDAFAFKQTKLGSANTIYPFKQRTSTKANFYNSLLELVSFIGGHTTSLRSPTMFNNDEIYSYLKTSAKVQIGVNVQIRASKGKVLQKQFNLHFEKKTNCP